MGNDPQTTPSTVANVERKLVAILSADVAGYSRLMGVDEVGTLRTLTAARVVTDSLIQQHHGRIVGTAGDSILAEFASAVDAVQCAVEIQHALADKNAAMSAEQRMEFRIGINIGDVVVEGEQIYGDGVNVAARIQSLADVGGISLSGTVYDQIENKLALNYEYLGEQAVKNITKPVRVWRIRDDVSVETPPRGSQSTVKRLAARASIARLSWVAAGLVLLAVTIVAVRYFSLSPPIPNPNPSPQPTPSTQSPIPNPQSLPLPDKPSIVVLPFDNMSKDPEQEYFSNGITEVLTSDLSRISSLFVIARNTAFTYKGKATNVQDIGKELGVRYVLEGSVQKSSRASAYHRAIARCHHGRTHLDRTLRPPLQGHIRPARRDRAEDRDHAETPALVDGARIPGAQNHGQPGSL